MVDNQILKFYESIRLMPERLFLIGVNRHKLTKAAVEQAMAILYQDRDKYPQISIGHRVFLEARILSPYAPEEPEKVPWWKRRFTKKLFLE